MSWAATAISLQVTVSTAELTVHFYPETTSEFSDFNKTLHFHTLPTIQELVAMVRTELQRMETNDTVSVALRNAINNQTVIRSS